MSTTADHQCQMCGARTPSGLALCARCVKTLHHALTNISANYADLDRAGSSAVRRRGSTVSDPTWTRVSAVRIDPVSAADAAATNALTTWGRVLADDRPQAGLPPRTVPELATWLSDHLRSIVTLGWAAEMSRDLLGIERQLKRVAEQIHAGKYLGVCGQVLQPEAVHDARSCGCSCHDVTTYGGAAPGRCDVPGGCHPEELVVPAVSCTAVLYAPSERDTVTCQHCGTTWDTQIKRRALVREAEDELLPVAGIARLASVFTGEVNVGRMEERIKKWAQRGKVEVADVRTIDGRPRKVYRVGDVLDLLANPSSNTPDRTSA